MEMPKGWKQLFSVNYVDDDFKYAMQDAGQLMKEMAEAIEVSIANPDLLRPEMQLRATLEKFKEWR
jgi:hypothetical protein